MITYVSLLRGINVSGQKIIKMDALKELYESLHFECVRTYIQSGNIVFQFKKSKNKYLVEKISSRMRIHFGFEVPVIVLEADELKDIIERNPFKADKIKDISYLHVTFLASEPEQFNYDLINKVKSPGEEISLIGSAVYLYCPNGYGRTKLTNTFLENRLKVGATTRNWKTTLELLNIAQTNHSS